MNADRVQAHLRTVRGWALENWGRMTRDPWLTLAGRREQQMGRFEASLAQSREIAESSFPLRVRARRS